MKRLEALVYVARHFAARGPHIRNITYFVTDFCPCNCFRHKILKFKLANLVFSLCYFYAQNTTPPSLYYFYAQLSKLDDGAKLVLEWGENFPRARACIAWSSTEINWSDLVSRPGPEVMITTDKPQVAISILTLVNSKLTEVNTKSTRDIHMVKPV